MLFQRLFAHPTRLLPLVSMGICICLLVGLLLAGCSSASSPAILQSTPAVTTAPAPAMTPLAQPPRDCALKSPPRTLHLDQLGGNTNVNLVGGGVFWIYGPYYQSVLHMARYGSQPWPIMKMVVEVGPNYSQPVTLQLREMRTGILAWWTDGQGPAEGSTQKLILNPQTDTQDVGAVPNLPDVPHGSPDPGWKEWGLFPMFSVAGCYELEVSWAGGSWQSVFAVGS
ncbi:MAG TPA: hypothetical protein VKV19_04970 [Ktedonobacteraceae bacterium]|nr:hypothetical protein [Ktedonobacteraceae bacterium]